MLETGSLVRAIRVSRWMVPHREGEKIEIEEKDPAELDDFLR